jgi:hypothetical protein
MHSESLEEHIRGAIESLQAELARAEAENAVLREALEVMIVGACAVAVPHAGERRVLQEAVDHARAAGAGKKEITLGLDAMVTKEQVAVSAKKYWEAALKAVIRDGKRGPVGR